MNLFLSTAKTGLKSQSRRLARTLFSGLLFFSLLSACTFTGSDIESPQLTPERTAKVNKVPEPVETVRGKEDPPVVTLQLGGALRTARLRPGEELPEGIKVAHTNLNNVPVTVALQAVLADTDITVLWDKAELQDRTVTLMNLKGALPAVVGRICRAARLLCAYRNGALELMEEDTFVVELPAAPSTVGTGGTSTTNTIADTIQALVNGKIKIDQVGGNLIYTADSEGHERVQSYLEQLRNGRPLIVMQLYIWQVTLDDSQQMGINWSEFSPAKIGNQEQSLLMNSVSSLKSIAAGSGVSLGAVFSGIVDANVVAKFLSTQGKVQNISSPQLTFISGTGAKFETGGTQKFVSQVGTLVAGSVSGTTSGTAGVSNNTVSTQDLKLGLAITVTGSYESGVVFASLEIKTSDLVKINEVNAGGTVLQLPITNDRTVNTVLRVRPGDNLVLAGLQTSTDTRSRDGLPSPLGGPGSTVPLFSSNILSNSETVILVKPSVVFFSDRELPATRSVERVNQGTAVAVLPKPRAPMMARDEDVKLPKRHSPLQDEFATAVHRFSSPPPPMPSASALPENIKPDYPPIRTP
ncbi:MAG: hypothetical protein HY053_05525 [Proteobacteria bacterium]|nr:hypothetical protein [Pseudomonadota bacterium]